MTSTSISFQNKDRWTNVIL